MCSIFDVYDKCVREGVKNDRQMMNRERNAAQTRYSLWWPAQWALSTTQHQSPPRGLVISLLTPTSVP